MSRRGGQGGGHSLLWSNNELLAQKKNVGEDARLLGHLDLIQRRQALSTSGLDVEFRRVYSDLKEVRTSTGHSAEALPPTPFRLHRLRGGAHKFSSSLEPMSLPSATANTNTSITTRQRPSIMSRRQRQYVDRGCGENEKNIEQGIDMQSGGWLQERSAFQQQNTDHRLGRVDERTTPPPHIISVVSRIVDIGADPSGQNDNTCILSGLGQADKTEPHHQHTSSSLDNMHNRIKSPQQYEQIVRMDKGFEPQRHRAAKSANDQSMRIEVHGHSRAKPQQHNRCEVQPHSRADPQQHSTVEVHRHCGVHRHGDSEVQVQQHSETNGTDNRSDPNSQTTSGQFLLLPGASPPSTWPHQGCPSPGISVQHEAENTPCHTVSPRIKGDNESCASFDVKPKVERSLSPRIKTDTASLPHMSHAEDNQSPDTKLINHHHNRVNHEAEDVPFFNFKFKVGGRLSPKMRNETTTLTSTSRVLGLDLKVKGQGRRYSVEFKEPQLSDTKWYHQVSEDTDILPEEEALFASILNLPNTPPPQSISTQQQTLTPTATHPYATETDWSIRRRSSATPCMTPVAKEISDMVESVRKKNEELLAVKAAAVALNNTRNRQLEQDHQNHLDQLKLLKVRTNRSSVKLPNTRYKCRTCQERLRDDTRYRHSLKIKSRQPVETHPAKDLDGNIIHASGTPKPSQRKGSEDPVKDRPWEKGFGSWKKADLQDSSVDMLGKTEGNMIEVKPRQPVYNRARIERLAEPKGGPKPRVHISGRVLRRQAEALRHPHRDQQLSEREQERLLRLQSRVRLFVALLQQRQTPATMVHIPQRDDIMHVDISHVL